MNGEKVRRNQRDCGAKLTQGPITAAAAGCLKHIIVGLCQIRWSSLQRTISVESFQNKNSQSTIQIITNDHGPDFSDKGVCNLVAFGQLQCNKEKDALA
jgi:hypothetical protein